MSYGISSPRVAHDQEILFSWDPVGVGLHPRTHSGTLGPSSGSKLSKPRVFLTRAFSEEQLRVGVSSEHEGSPQNNIVSVK